MEASSDQPINKWSSVQVYAMATICLFLGIATGFLLHAPKTAVAPANHPPLVEKQGPQPAMAAAPAMPSPDHMQRMADKAVEPVLAQLKTDPNNPDLLAKAATIYFRGQQFSQAAAYYDRSVRARPTAEGYVSLSNTYHYAGEDDRAIASLNEALKLDPKSANALFNLGMLKLKAKNDPKAAVEAWQRLLKTNPNHPRRAQVESMIAKAKLQIEQPANSN